MPPALTGDEPTRQPDETKQHVDISSRCEGTADGRHSTYPEVAAGGVDLVDVGVVHLVVGRLDQKSSRRWIDEQREGRRASATSLNSELLL